MNNLLLQTDSYKLSHYVQYPKGTENVYSYFESRTGAKYNRTVFFGLQYYLKKYLYGQVVTNDKIKEANEFSLKHIGMFNKDGWEYILKNHDGRLPVIIKAIPEGIPVNVSNVLMTIENIDKNCYWLTNYLETLLVQVWYPCTVATQSREIKKILNENLNKTSDSIELDFKLHDFGYRGSTSEESAAIGGMAHLVNFMGSDTIAGVLFANKYYGCDMAGYSIPASEHSTITSWGKENEISAFRNMLNKYKDFPIVACVSDSWDIYNACENLWGNILKYEITQRKGILVVRPDSGDPKIVLPKVFDILGEKFGSKVNSKGYKTLSGNVSVIQGDGIDIETIPEILSALNKSGWCAEKLSFGSGGGLLQKLNRDTQRFAFKCSNVTINGNSIGVYKQPVTDSSKNSKMGKLKLLRRINGYYTVNQEISGEDSLVDVFKDGEILEEYTYDSIRKNAAI